MGSKDTPTQTAAKHEKGKEKEKEEEKDKQEITQQPLNKTVQHYYYGEIIAREKFFILLYTSPERNLQTLNHLLDTVDRKQLCSNMWGAIATGEIHHDLIPKIEEVLQCSREWEYFPLTFEDIDPPLQAFLRWLLMTFGGSKLWTEFSKKQITFINDLLEAVQKGEVKTSMPRYLKTRENELQYLSDLLNENMALDCFAERFECDATGKPGVVRNDTGFSNFTTANKPNISTSQTKLLMWVDHTLRQWRKAVKHHRPEMALSAPHREYYAMGQTGPSTLLKEEQQCSRNHESGPVDEKVHEEIKAFSKLIKKLRTPPAAEKNTHAGPITLKRSAVKKSALAKSHKITHPVSPHSHPLFPMIY